MMNPRIRYFIVLVIGHWSLVTSRQPLVA